jgi:uncharacterized protein (TIGR02266 family)
MDQANPKEPRGPVSLRIKFRSASLEQFIERYGVDVSRGGIFIRTREPLAVGTQLRFDFQLQDAAPLLAGEGTVVWIRENDPSRAGVTPGMGVRFDKLTPATQPTLEKILAEKGRRELAGAPAKPSAASGMAVRQPSSTFSALDPAAGRAAQPAPPSGPPRVGGLSPLGAAPRDPAPRTGSGPVAVGAAPRAAQPATGSGPMRTGAQPRAAASATGSGPVATGAAPRAALPAAESNPLAPRTRSRTGENAVPGGIPTLESSGAFGRPRASTGMNAQRPAPAPAALFEKPTSEDIDRALSVLTEIDGPPPAAPAPVPVDFSAPARTRHPTDAQPMVLESATDVGDAPKAPHRRDTDAQPMVLESGPDLGEGVSRRTGTGTRPLFSGGTGEHRMPTQPVVPIGGPPPEAFRPEQAAASGAGEEPLLDEEEEDGATSAWVSSGPTKVGGPELEAAMKKAGGGPELPKAAPPSLTLDVPPPSRPALDGKPAPAAPAAAAPAPAAFHAPPPKRSNAPAMIIVLLLAGAGAGYFLLKDKIKGGPQTAGTETAPAVGVPGAAPAPGENAVADAGGAVAAQGEAPAAEKAPEKAPEAKSPTGEATPLTLRARPLGEEMKAPPPEAKPAEAKPAEAKASERQRRGKRRGGGGAAAEAPAAAPAEAAPVVADVSPGAAEAAAPAAAAPAQTGIALKISTTPGGAEVIIDGNSVGKTPFQSGDVDPNLPHSITLKKDGFEAHEHMISGSDWPRPKNGVRTLKLNVKLRSAGGGEAKPAESEAPAEVPPGLGTTPASPKRE